MFEMLSGSKPWAKFSNLEVPHQVLSGRRPPIQECMCDWRGEHGSAEIALRIEQIVTDCWAQDPKDRPSMEDVLTRLTWCLEESERRSREASAAVAAAAAAGMDASAAGGLDVVTLKKRDGADSRDNSGPSLRQLSSQSIGSEASYMYTALDDLSQSNVVVNGRVQAKGDALSNNDSSQPVVGAADAVAADAYRRAPLSRPTCILRVGDGRVELDRQNTFPVKDSLLKPLGFHWDTERRVWWKTVGQDGADGVCRKLENGLLARSMTLKLEKLIEPDELDGYLGEKSHEIQTLHDELDELDGYLSESEGFDDDT